MALNRQEAFGEVNPLFKKFVTEGEKPSPYIPADKRRQIYEYMGKVNYTKGVIGKCSDKSLKDSQTFTDLLLLF